MNLPNAFSRWEADEREAREREASRRAPVDTSPASTRDPSRSPAHDTSILPPPLHLVSAASSGTTATSSSEEPGDGGGNGDGQTGDPPGGGGSLFERMDRKRKKRDKRRRQQHRREASAPVYRREEIATVGFDDFVQTLGADPYGTATRTGIRLPALAAVRYLVLGAVVDLNEGDRVVGWGKLLTLGAQIALGDGVAPYYVIEKPVSTVPWQFQDGGASFHLMASPLVQQVTNQGPADQDSFTFEDAGTCALVYETATGATGSAGYLGLTAYTPPAMIGQPIVATRDVRDAFTSGEMEYLNIPIDRPMRIRAYIAVLQTDPTKRNKITVTDSGFTDEGIPPEENFLQVTVNGTVLKNAARYWRCAVKLIVERRIR